ncbi:MAG: ABC-2 family transporter protein [Elusimicrobiales bacterium]|nr:ABC-2 family transporter protein [Elusimicrobiales bacterium]
MIRTIFISAMLNFKSRIIYRWDFLAAIGVKGLETVVSYLLLNFLLAKVPLIAGYDRGHVILMFGLTELAFALWHCFFINSLSIGSYVREGQMDRFLLRPMNPVIQIILDGFDEDGWGGLAVAIATVALAANLGAGPTSVSEWCCASLIAFCGALIFFSISLTLSSLSLWSQTQGNLGLVVMDIRVFARFPSTIYPGWLRAIVSSIVPLAACGYWPALFIADKQVECAVWIVLATASSLALSTIIFNELMRRLYESSGT